MLLCSFVFGKPQRQIFRRQGPSYDKMKSFIKEVFLIRAPELKSFSYFSPYTYMGWVLKLTK